MNLLELTVRVSIGFLVLFLLARIIGRKEISQMTFFNFVSAIAIGSISASLVVIQTLSIRNGVLALAGWTLFTLVMGYIDIKSKKARMVTTGEPVIVIKEGKIAGKSLRKCRLDMDSLLAMLRQKNIFSVSDVDYAVFETNGQLSVLRKELSQPVTKSDLNINPKIKMYPFSVEVVSDGEVLTENLSKLRLDSSWLEQQLKQAGAPSVSDVSYAEVQQDGSLYVDKKKEFLQ